MKYDKRLEKCANGRSGGLYRTWEQTEVDMNETDATNRGRDGRNKW